MPATKLSDEYLGIPLAARESGLCTKTIRLAIKSGCLRAGRTSAGPRGRWRIRRSDLAAWLESNAHGARIQPRMPDRGNHGRFERATTAPESS